MINVLIIEDESSIRKFVKINLERKNLKVFEAESAEIGLEILNKEKIDIILLDLMLPGIDGIESCKIIREKNKNVGIIMLTAKSQDEDKISGLTSGADDYITKPFNPTELILRIEKLYSRIYKLEPEETIIKEGVFTLNLKSREFFKADKFIELTPTEFNIIEMFLKNKDKAFSRDEILNIIWGEKYLGDSKIVDVNIRRIRSKIEDDPANPEYLLTVWGVGYKFR